MGVSVLVFEMGVLFNKCKKIIFYTSSVPFYMRHFTF
jgi:hypothetical protein